MVELGDVSDAEGMRDGCQSRDRSGDSGCQDQSS
jgi:hypothetical protein